MAPLQYMKLVNGLHTLESHYLVQPTQAITEATNKVHKAMAGGSKHLHQLHCRHSCHNCQVCCQCKAAAAGQHFTTFFSEETNAKVCSEMDLKALHFHTPLHAYLYTHSFSIHYLPSANLQSQQKFPDILKFWGCTRVLKLNTAKI